jgi:hypothetical protein
MIWVENLVTDGGTVVKKVSRKTDFKYKYLIEE